MKNTKKKNGAAKGKGRAALSAQQTIPYLSMHPDGVCKLPGGLYTKTVEYEDINYSVASTEDQTAIFSGWSSFLNYFDSSLPFQLSFINRRSHSRSRYQVNIPKADDNYNSVRDEFTGMLKNQIAKSNNGIERSKYITFGIPAEGIAEARPRLILGGCHGVIDVLIFHSFCIEPTRELAHTVRVHGQIRDCLLGRQGRPAFTLGGGSVFFLCVFQSHPPFQRPARQRAHKCFRFGRP